ncbi:MAG TPA: hypothetical protein PLZ44_03535 [Methanothrix sp.]|nr:hypothetical protein [Methanothrix sp.]
MMIMRLAILIVAITAIIALQINQSSSILDGGLGLNADQLIDQSNGKYHYSIGMPENPQDSREEWSEKSGIDFNKTGVLSKNNTPDTTAKASRSSIQTSATVTYQTAGNGSQGQASAAIISSPATEPSLEASAEQVSEALARPEGSSGAAASAASMDGNWTFRLKDSKNRILALRLISSDDSIFGTGTMNDGGDTMKASASGSVAAGNISLDVITTGTVSLFRLEMAMNASESIVSGEYRAFSKDSNPWTGTVQGKRAD